MRCPGRGWSVLAVACLVPSAWAWAQEADAPSEEQSRYERAMDRAAAEASASERLLVEGRGPNSVTLSMGMLGFMDEGRTPGEAMGPGWSLRYGYQPNVGWAGWELALVNGTAAGDAEYDVTVFIVETAVKFSAVQQRPWSPLVAVGVGYGVFAGPVQTDMETLVVPVSVGIEGGTNQALFGLRATWRPSLVGESVMPGRSNHDTWQILADAGVRF